MSNNKKTFFSWLRNNKKNKINNNNNKKKTSGFLNKLKKNLLKTRDIFTNRILSIFKNTKVNDSLFEKLEETLLMSDVGLETTKNIINNLIKSNNINKYDNKKIYLYLKKELVNILKKVEKPSEKLLNNKTFIILVVGVNGVGKTSTIGKIAYKYKKKGKSVMLVAADIFRAGAVDQLKKIGNSISVPVISDSKKKDSSSIIFDAINIAKSKKLDVLIIDTAGRLHNKKNLMNELKKNNNVIKKLNNGIKHEVLLVIDSCSGQNSVAQTNLFYKEIDVSGLVVTKLDGTAKGGIIFSISDKLNIPIRYISFGKSINDLKTFNAKKFVNALLDNK
ncbi:signal recognition particle-docking protein FtsY [Buchnera aphidicola (Taiwanaphis decaspermi)]|uniref:signal recognition particle-docking protein FtsY n=1 Tax=Buchnera aphidicola TaxID=9 RepID=UPI0031B8078B